MFKKFKSEAWPLRKTRSSLKMTEEQKDIDRLSDVIPVMDMYPQRILMMH
jgi:hypothetical protein